jgi:hypothetical protein
LFEVLLGSDRQPLDPRLPVHDAIRTVLQRSLRFTPPCNCAAPWIRACVAGSWREGRLEVTEIEACCSVQRRAAIRELPPAMVPHLGASERAGLPWGDGYLTSMRLLLDDCVVDRGDPLPDGVLVTPKERQGLSACSRSESMVLRCEVPVRIDGTSIQSLLVRPLYHSPALREALEAFAPVSVVAYWRRYGFEWTPRSIAAAERFGLGVGGSMAARLTRLFPDVMPSTYESLQSAAQGS